MPNVWFWAGLAVIGAGFVLAIVVNQFSHRLGQNRSNRLETIGFYAAGIGGVVTLLALVTQ